jgi:hypothetical protein
MHADEHVSGNILVRRTSPVLTSESQREFETMQEEFFREVAPANFIERMYANEVIELFWEVRRLRRCKAALIDSMQGVALKNLIALAKGSLDGREEEQKLATAYLGADETARGQVVSFLSGRGLDQTALDAEAVSMRLDDLEKIERMIASMEQRRDKALVKIAEYRTCLAELLQTEAARLLEVRSDAAGQGEPPPDLAVAAE